MELMEKIGAGENDAEDLSTLANLIEGVDCGVVLRELTPGEWKISLRTDAKRVNATQACKLLGGGGHAAAAGATIRGTLEEVKAAVLDAVNQVAVN